LNVQWNWTLSPPLLLLGRRLLFTWNMFARAEILISTTPAK